MQNSGSDGIPTKSGSPIPHKADSKRVYTAKVSRVIDGDTIDCSVDLGFFVFILCRFRLARINAPEIQTSSGKELKEKLRDIEGVDCRVESSGRDRYGRWVAEIFLNDRGNLSDWLLELGLVAHYV